MNLSVNNFADAILKFDKICPLTTKISQKKKMYITPERQHLENK